MQNIAFFDSLVFNIQIKNSTQAFLNKNCIACKSSQQECQLSFTSLCWCKIEFGVVWTVANYIQLRCVDIINKMTKSGKPLLFALVVLLFTACYSQTITVPSSSSKPKSSYPTANDVASIGSSPVFSDLGVTAGVGLGGNTSNNSSGLQFDANALDQLSQMVNQILASLNNTSSIDSTQSTQNAKADPKSNSKSSTDSTAKIDPVIKPNPTATTNTKTTSSSTSGDNKKPTSSQTNTVSTSPSPNTKTNPTTTTNTKPSSSANIQTTTKASDSSTQTDYTSNNSFNTPNNVINSSKPSQYIDPLFSFQDFLTNSNINTSTGTDSDQSTSSRTQPNILQKNTDNSSDGLNSENSSNIDATNSTSSENDTAMANATSIDNSTVQDVPDNTPKTTTAETKTNKKYDSSPVTQDQPTKTRSSSSNICTTDQDCLLSFGSYAAAGLTITCKKDQGVCTFE